MTGLPAGTVTFLFSDIERSTQNVSSLGDERYAELQEVHRRLLRDAFAAHRGHEVGTEGDSFFVAFSRAGDAIGAAIDGQRALESHEWPSDARIRVRMGIPAGEALIRDDDYVGHDVNKAKRLYQVVADDLPSGSLRSVPSRPSHTTCLASAPRSWDAAR